MTFTPALYGTIDTNNSTTTPLAGNGTFTGTSTNVSNYSNISITITTDQSSAAADGFDVQFSQNGTNWDIIRDTVFLAPTAGTSSSQTFIYKVEARFFRIVYTNGPTLQGVFRLQTLLSANTQSITSIQGATDGTINYPTQTRMTNDGALHTYLSGPSSSFGDLRTVQPTPVVQANFVYGVNSNYFTATGFTGATFTGTNNQLGQVTTTTANGSSGILQTRSYYKYREGLGGLARFTTLYSTGVANNNQIMGVGDTVNGYFFGYNGTSFGILYRRNSVDTWIPQTTWNIDTCLGTGGPTNSSGLKLDPTKGNVYQITIAYLGFAGITFFIYNQAIDFFMKVHVLEYANLNTVPLVTNPSMTVWLQTYNTAAAGSTVTTSTASVGLFVDGQVTNLGSKYGRANNKTAITTQTNIISIRCNTTINSIINKSAISLSSISFSSASATAGGLTTLNMFLGATVGGTPVFTNVDATNSIAAFDTAGTTVTGGTIIRSYTQTNNASMLVPFSNEILIFPGDTITFAMTNSATATASVSVNWIENT